jgi:uncharacterized protein YndB with AHSA1/START domain
MSITSVDTDYDNLTITVIAEFDAPVDQVWELWSDPRKLERWWGPPGYPTAFEKHELRPGGEVTYFHSGPDGGTTWGAWRVTAVDPPASVAFTDSFAEEDGTPAADSPVTTVNVELTERDGGTRMEMRLTYESREEMEKLLDLGMLEGLHASVGRMDALL